MKSRNLPNQNDPSTSLAKANRTKQKFKRVLVFFQIKIQVTKDMCLNKALETNI